MAKKPHIKLKAARAAGPAAAKDSRHLDRALALLAETVGMSSAEVLRKPYEARDRFKSMEVEAELARRITSLGMSPEELAAKSPEEIRALITKRHTAGPVAAFRNRAMSIIRTCQVTGQMGIAAKMIEQDLPPDRATEYIFDVAAAASDGQGINNAHSPEGGHKAGIDYTKIYSRQNERKGVSP